jgi:predicted DNA-binding antitoxin AbrB/MazE fold protein
MTTTIQAVYEGGVFRPVHEVALTEGTQVEVSIPAAASPRQAKAVAARLAQIADKARATGHPDSASREHDEFLYRRRVQP